MTSQEPEVSPLVRRKAAALGPPGERWLAGLGALVAELERRWSITAGGPLSGGTEAHVVRARTADGRDAVLKLALPGPERLGEPRVLAAARGHGYARLLAHDAGRHALLLEALGPSAAVAGLGPERTIEVLCGTLRQVWRTPVTAVAPVTAAEEKAGLLGRMVARLWEELGRPCSARVVDRALLFAERRAAAFDPERSVVVHGDPHPGNALRVLAPRPGAASGYVFVDPDGFLADPAYDLGVVLRDWCPQLLAGDAPAVARGYCGRLAAATGVDERAIWEWGFLERVSTGLYTLHHGAEDLSRPFLETAERLV
ncbi:aminoglycoside phosphotransferase family protein [Streptomyces sp. NPDC014894]|uniref:aminoglycoside phosphotransferase family protein n=1 Tax=unclassified Streptomyces TaxID=2593676 RepID=UPI003700995E